MGVGKGDKPRPVDGNKYRRNFDRIFKPKTEEKKKKSKWNGIFESVTYSSGPGDNTYIYG